MLFLIMNEPAENFAGLGLAKPPQNRLILSRHHYPRDPMRLPSACAASVPFRARYQFSRGFSLRGENDYIWKFLGGFFVLEASKLSRESIKRHVFVRRTRHGGIIQCNNPASKRQRTDRGQHGDGLARSSDDVGTTRQELGATDRSHSEFEGGHSSLLWRRRY